MEYNEPGMEIIMLPGIDVVASSGDGNAYDGDGY